MSPVLRRSTWSRDFRGGIVKSCGTESRDHAGSSWSVRSTNRPCGVRTEEVPWARPGARLTRDLEDLVAWCAKRMDKTAVARFHRVSWASVARAVMRVFADELDDARLDHLFRIGMDEVSWRKGHRYLTVVADHDRDDAVVWAGEGRSAAGLPPVNRSS